MKKRQGRLLRKSAVECLETRALMSVGLNGPSLAHPGTLNPGFGTGGFATLSLDGPSFDKAAGVAISHQADGKIVVAGTANGVSAQGNFAVVRENADGNGRKQGLAI